MIVASNIGTYGHRRQRTEDPVRSPILKLSTGGLVLRWVTTWEYPLLYVLPCFCCRVEAVVIGFGTLDILLETFRNGLLAMWELAKSSALHLDSHSFKDRKISNQGSLASRLAHHVVPRCKR